MATVSFEGVCKRYGDQQVVHEVDLAIAHGEFVVLVGPSGCGKSTTLRMLAGLEEISAGFVRIDGRVVNDEHPKNRDIAMVFQSYALYPHMNVRDNMSFGLRMRGMPRTEIQAKVAHAAQILGIEDLLERKPKALSGGQRQRVAMGRAIVRDPKVFLFDEPLSNLDAKMRVQMRAEIARLHRRLQTTTLYVTHDQVEAMTLAGRMVVMHQGRIQQVGPPLEVYSQPANQFVAGFIGSPAMNFLPGHLDGSGRFQSEGFAIATASRWAYQGEATLGIRPTDLAVLPAQPDQAAPGSLEATVDVVEPLGAETYLTLQLTKAQMRLMARVDPSTRLAPGDRVHLRPDPARLHLFEADNGARITREGAA